MENGEYDIPSDKDVVVPKRSSDNKNVKPITDEELFYILQSKFKSIFNDSTKRDQFIKKVIPAWYYKRIDNEVHNSWNSIDKNVKKTFDDIGVI